MPTPPRLAKLGQLFVRAGVLDAARVASIVSHAEQFGSSFARAVVELGMTTEGSYVEALARVTGLPAVDVQAVTLPPQVAQLVDAATCEEHTVLPLAVADGGRTLQLAMADPTDLEVVDAIAKKTGTRVKQLVAGEGAITAAIRRCYYGETGPAEEFKLLNSAGKTLHPKPSAEAPAAGAEPREAPAPSELEALRSAVEAQEKMLRALVDALMQKGLLSAEELLRARRAAQGK